jgi:hypothetical protein
LAQSLDIDEESIIAELSAIWRTMFGRDPGSLQGDLEALGMWFDHPSERRLLEQIAELEPVSWQSELAAFEPPPILVLAEERAVVTPEGRVLLEGLRAEGSDTAPAALSETLLETYRGWAYGPLIRAGDLVEGRRDRMKAVSMAVATVLMAYGADASERALVISGQQTPAATEALRQPLLAMKRALGEEPRLKDPFEGFPLTHAKRHLGSDLHRQPKTGRPLRLWLEGDRLEAIAERLAGELVRRRGLSRQEARRVFEATIDSYLEQQAALARHGLVGAPEAAEATRRRLLSAVDAS